MRILLILVVLSILGCASEARYKEVLNSWIGASEHQLTASWGIPHRVYNNGDRKIFEYSNGGNMIMPGNQTYATSVYGNTAYTQSYGTPAYNIHLSCVTTFQIYNGQIESYSYRGNHCVAD